MDNREYYRSHRRQFTGQNRQELNNVGSINKFGLPFFLSSLLEDFLDYLPSQLE